MDFIDISQKSLIKILSAGIRNTRVVPSCYSCIDWQTVAYEADRHKVAPIVYYSVMQNSDIKMPDDIKEKLRRKFLFEIREQERNYLAFGEILKKLTDSNISVVILKGLFLRDLYHEPLLRSMRDYDVLVKPEDFEKVAFIMENAGYKKAYREDKHAKYSHPHYMLIEIHKSLIPADRFKNSSEFEEKIWKSVIPAKVSGVDVLTLDPTDHAVYLVLHMAFHIESSGIGLRQLCDLVLFIEAYRHRINWDTFNGYIKLMGVETFTQALFEVCHRLFDLEVPHGWECDEGLKEVADRLILDIFESGVFGNESNDRITANRMIYYSDSTEIKTFRQKIQTLLSLFFPKAEKLDIRYQYARKHRFLLPVAWIHRFAYIIIRKDISISEKLAVFRPKKASEIFTNRSLLLRQLGLID